MTTATKCRAKDPATCADPNCPEKRGVKVGRATQSSKQSVHTSPLPSGWYEASLLAPRASSSAQWRDFVREPLDWQELADLVGTGEQADATAATTSMAAACAAIEQVAARLGAVKQAEVAGYLSALTKRQELVQQELDLLTPAPGSEVSLEQVRSVVDHNLLPVVGWLRLALADEGAGATAELRAAIAEQVQAATALLNTRR